MNIVVLVLLRAWSSLTKKLRVMSHFRQDMLYLGASLLGTTCLIQYVLKQMDPMTAVRKQTAAKAREVEARLGAPMHGVTQHELMAVECVIAPETIDIMLQDIGGLDNIVEQLMKSLSVHTGAALPGAAVDADAGVGTGLLKHPKGVLLYGPPGTGKTMMAKALAKYLNAFFVVVKPSDVQSKWYGETNKAIAGVFKLACRLAKTEGKSCIIFVDEVDALLGKRKDIEHEVSLSMKTEFMALWDGIETSAASRVVILGATNRPHELDEAVLRRFTLALHVPLPDAAAREDILKAHLERHCRLHALGDDAVDHSLLQNDPLNTLGGKRPLEWLAEKTEEYSGADLLTLVVEAVRNSIAAIMPSYREQALSGSVIKPVVIDPSEQPPIRLADFEAAFRVYQPTQQKAASFQANSSAAMPWDSMMATFAELARASNVHREGNGSNNDNQSHDDNDDIPVGNGVSQ